MARSKRKKLVTRKESGDDDSFATLRARRSSMRVNLSFVSSLSDSGLSKRTTDESRETASEEPFVRNDGIVSTVKKCKTKKIVHNESLTSASDRNVTVVNGDSHSPSTQTVTEQIQSTSLNIITEKEQQLNRSCMQLKDAIMRKTQAFFDKENELAIKTSEVLASGYVRSPIHNIGELDEDFGKRSPSIRVNLKKNEQVVMSGDGKRRNPVQISSMFSQSSPTREQSVSSDITEDDQSIVSTPKKIRTDSSSVGDNSSIRNSQTMLRIPVARLFADNDPNNSLSEVNPVNRVSHSSPMETDANAQETSASAASNISRISNDLNYSTSPILSQGNRRSRLSLSLKKKCQKNVSQAPSRLSTTTVNESFINKGPLTCSSFIEIPSNVNKINEETEESRTVNLAEKSNSVKNCKTIDLEDNSKTIEIENSTNTSCMEITAVSSKMPIIRRSIQQQAHKSQNTITHSSSKNSSVSRQRLNSSTLIQNKESNKEVNALESVEHTNSNNMCQENCSTITARTSLNVNTSLDRISSVDHIVQKENKTPNNLQENAVNCENHTDKGSDPAAVQCQNTYSARSSMQVNTSLDSVKKSSNTSNKNLESSNKLQSRQSTNSIATTVRSSMQVNTSLDSVRKSPSKKNSDFNKMLSMVQETSTNENQSTESVYTSKEQSSESDSDLENVSLMERIRNISATKKNGDPKIPSNKASTANKSKEIKDASSIIVNKSTNKTRKSAANKNTSYNEAENENNNSSTTRKSVRLENNSSKRKSIGGQNISSNSNESSVIEATPYPVSRSVLMKTMIKNSIATNTIDPRRFVNYSDDENSNTELETINKNKSNSSSNKYTSVYARKEICTPDSMDTVVLDSSDESMDESDKKQKQTLIEESLNETKGSKSDKSMNKSKKNNTSGDEQSNSKKEVIKRKLYPVRENSQLVSFSSTEDLQDPPAKKECQEIKPKKTRKLTQKKRQGKKQVQKSPVEESEAEENNILPEKAEKKKKKPRKIKSKKIVVKKVTNMTLLDNMMNDDSSQKDGAPRLSDRNSLREFDFKKSRSRRKESTSRGPKINIVVTGLSKEDKDLIKSVIKTLGSAVLEENVTPRTTHVISSGVRTVNLLKGIIRGCWMVSLEWALKSLESQKWLDPSPFELSHFSKAVKENRRDRQLFGKAYVPDLFVTCGFIYVENGTSPPKSTLKELIKTAGGRITDDPGRAEIIIGSDGLKEIWVLDSITTNEVQSIDEYKRN
ncbi:hypothetical protein TSAR_010451 [Trichomalopsis sarcophagae]|uniref:BRCT domain-containing protein n=1 Tax=Trichomalopsis sarcophagae TaxID=543379 RepID=A0A232ENX4_9HYME|nr:hypothetical protein TSAR_010451 [Trichomalopsis sarcophagae]